MSRHFARARNLLLFLGVVAVCNGLCLGGGVAANSALRARLAADADALGIPLIVPRPGLCTDNGAMIGAAGFRRFVAGERAGPDLEARPSYKLAIRETASPAAGSATGPTTSGTSSVPV